MSRAPAALEYPRARRVDTVDVLHGTAVADPYRWMEQLDDPELGSWLGRQEVLTETWLDGVPCRAGFRRRVEELLRRETAGVPRPRGGAWFQLRKAAGANQPGLVVLDSPDGEARVLLAPEQLGEDEVLMDWEPSHDGRLVLYSTSTAGSDWRTWHVIGSDGRPADQPVTAAKLWACWAPGSDAFFYITFPAAVGERDQPTNVPQLKLHRLGRPQAEDELVFEDRDEPRYFFAACSGDGRHLVLTFLLGAKQLTEIMVAPAAGPWRFTSVARSQAELWYLGSRGDELLVATTDGAPRGRVVSIDARDPNPDRWREVVPEDSELVLPAAAHAALCGDWVLTAADRLGRTVIRLHRVDGTDARTVDIPDAGRIVHASLAEPASISEDGAQVYVAVSTVGSPETLYRYGIADDQAAEVHGGAAKLEIEADVAWAVSADGTSVPMTVVRDVRAPGLERPPVLLEGYGGAGDIMRPFDFNAQKLAWLELGGVIATAHLRGGGELGAGWWEAGRGAAGKRRAIEDFLGCARWLAENVTTPDRIAITGRSSGAMLAAAAVLKEPAAFGALVGEVGMYDPLRYHLFGLGRLMAREYGCSEDEADFRELVGYSPYHNVVAGTAYPPTLLTHHGGDNRVSPGSSFKFLSRLQEAQGAPEPVLLRTRADAGHFGGPVAGEAAERGDILAFLAAVLGAPPCRP